MGRKILKFGASWCAPCKAIAPAFDELAKEYAGVAVFEAIDVDADIAKANGHNVRGVPTVIVLQDGREVARATGAQASAPSALKGFVRGVIGY